MNNHSSKKIYAVSFIMTLIICSFLLFSGVALHNTAAAMFGTDQSVLELTATESQTHFEAAFGGEKYIINLSGVNRIAGDIEQNYALLPRSFRLLQAFFDSLKEGFDCLF